MFALVKKLFGKSQPAPPAAPARASQPFSPSPFASKAAAKPVAAVATSPKPPVPQTASAPQAAPPAPARKTGLLIAESDFSAETIDLPLKSIWSKLPPELVKLAHSNPSGSSFLKLPVNLVQAHLARGSLKIPLQNFRQFSPEGLFNGNGTTEIADISIPIPDLLARLKPDQLARRANQKKVQVPDDIEPIFGPSAGKKGHLRIATEKSKSAATPAATPAVETPPPVAPVQPIAPVTPIPVAETTPAPAAPPAETVEPSAPSEPLRAPNLDPALASLRPLPPVPAKTRQDQTFTLALMDVAGFWAEKGHIELENLYRHSLEIPMSALEAALKRGKVEFTWREVRPWVRLASGNTMPTSISDDTMVELPLPLIASHFLDHQRNTAPKKRIEISEEIPDVFVRQKAATPAHVVPPPIPPAPLAPAESQAEVDNSEPRDFGQIFGQPDKKDWSLGEVSQRTTGLPGVAGAIIATSDGLLVGGKWPGAGGETVAAFVPQMYTRMAGCTKELQLGEPRHFTLLIDDVPLQIFKSADSYFTVLGRAGESLPTRELNAIASRLAASLTEN